MKRKNICAEAALREVARKNHTTVEEVRKEIRLAMIAAMCNPDPAMQLIMTPSAAVIKISIPTAGEANGIGFCHFAGRRSGKGGDTPAENGCEADQQRHKP